MWPCGTGTQPRGKEQTLTVVTEDPWGAAGIGHGTMVQQQVYEAGTDWSTDSHPCLCIDGMLWNVPPIPPSVSR